MYVVTKVLRIPDMQAMPLLCAWCLEEQGEVPEEDASHGICPPHAKRELDKYYAQKAWQDLQAVPSYVEVQAALFAQEE